MLTVVGAGDNTGHVEAIEPCLHAIVLIAFIMFINPYELLTSVMQNIYTGTFLQATIEWAHRKGSRHSISEALSQHSPTIGSAPTEL